MTANDTELADLNATDPPERDDWITDVDATIHNLMGDDGENDDTNDWVHDVANALWKQVGLRDFARLRELSAEVERLRAAGNKLADVVGKGVLRGYEPHPAVDAWRALGEES